MKGIRMDVLKRIQGAVESISHCSNPSITASGITAIGNRLNSPYITRQSVEYHYGPTYIDEYTVIAENNRYCLVINGEDCLPKASPRNWHYWDNFDSIDVPIKYEFVGGIISSGMLQPVLDLAIKLGLKLPRIPDLVIVYVDRPALAGWHWNQKVPIVVDEDGNEIKIDESAFVAKQGDLDIYKTDMYLRHWRKGELFFDHWTGNEGVNQDNEGFVLKAIPLAVVSKWGYEAAVRLESNKEIVIRASDEDPLILEPGSYVCLHPFISEK